MITLSISASKTYDVLLAPGLLGQAGTLISEKLGPGALAAGPKICIVADATVDSLYCNPDGTLWRSLENAGFQLYKYVFPGGEDHKTMETVEKILDFLTEKEFSRSDLLLALGGGITGDVTGFAAAVYLRGIDYVQVPTSLLAIVDSSVGGKTGVNLAAGKNLAGAFWQPRLVLFDSDVLETLNSNLLLDGLAEIIKAGMIADETILAELPDAGVLDAAAEARGPSEASPTIAAPAGECRNALPLMDLELIAKSIRVKRTLVEEDERDDGSRQLLNFGHTLAHAIEKLSGYRICHGHAVAMGMDLVCAASERLGWTEAGCSQRLRSILESFAFPLECSYGPEELAAAALQDKKRRGDHIALVIPEKPGRCVLQMLKVSQLTDFIRVGLDRPEVFCPDSPVS